MSSYQPVILFRAQPGPNLELGLDSSPSLGFASLDPMSFFQCVNSAACQTPHTQVSGSSAEGADKRLWSIK